MVFCTSCNIICWMIYILASLFSSFCTGKPYTSGKDGNYGMFADQLRRVDDTNNIINRRATDTGSKSDKLLDNVEKRDLSKMFYGSGRDSDNAIPGYQDYLKTNELPNAGGQQSPWSAPKYMIELYHKFETDRYSHPLANIVRSFVNIYEGCMISAPVFTSLPISILVLYTIHTYFSA